MSKKSSPLDAVKDAAADVARVEGYRDEMIVAAVQAGYTNGEVAEAAGLSPGWVSKILRRCGYRRRPGRPNKGNA